MVVLYRNGKRGTVILPFDGSFNSQVAAVQMCVAAVQFVDPGGT
jgi:hypothetical protein